MANPFEDIDRELTAAAVGISAAIANLSTVVETGFTAVARSVDAARVEYEEVRVTVARLERTLMEQAAASRQEMAALREQSQREMAALREQSRQEMAALREEIAQLRADLRARLDDR